MQSSIDPHRFSQLSNFHRFIRAGLPAFAGALLAILFSSALRAENYNLQQCIEQAKKNRPSVVRARGDKSIAGADVRQKVFGLLSPRADLSYSKNSSKETDQRTDFVDSSGGVSKDFAIPDQERASKSVDISGSVTLFDGFANFHELAASRKNQRRADYELQTAEADLALEVRVGYYAYLAAVQNLAVQIDAVGRSKEQLNLVQSRYDVGSAALSDVLKQKVLFGNDNLSLLDAQNAEATTKADLAYVAGIDMAENPSFDTTVTVEEYGASKEDAVRLGMDRYPGLLASKMGFEAAKLNSRASYGGYLPSVQAAVSRSWFDGNRADNLDVPLDFSSTSTSWRVSANWNLFDGLIRERTVVQSKVARNNALAAHSDERNRVELAITKAFLGLNKASEQVKVSEENVASASQDMSLAQEKYNLGAASILELLDAQVTLKDAQVKLIRARFDKNLAVSRLRNATGEE